MEWKPGGKRPRDGSRKQWLDAVEEDVNALGEQVWIREIVEDHVVMVPITLVKFDLQ